MVERTDTIPTELALSFDDGPDPTWTPKILDILKRYHVVGTFFMIGEEAQDNVGADEAGLSRRPRDRQSHLHASRHQRNLRRSSRSSAQPYRAALRRQAGRAAGLFARPTPSTRSPTPTTRPRPSSVSSNSATPSSATRSTPTTGSEHPRKIPQEIIGQRLSADRGDEDALLDAGHIILLHDGGGNRSATVAALPLLITTLRANGYDLRAGDRCP